MSIHACESGENHLIHILLTYVGITLLKFLENSICCKTSRRLRPSFCEHTPKAAQLIRTLVPAFDCTLSLHSAQI